MKKSLVIVLILSFYKINSQCSEKEFCLFVDKSVSCLKKINKEKYNKVNGIELETDKTGYVISYNIFFIDDSQALTQTEYDFLLKKLRQKTYGDCIKQFYTNDELKKETKLRWKKRINPKK